MSFEGFKVTHTIPDSSTSIRVSHITCLKCGAEVLRGTSYMKYECTKIKCKKCGHTATRNSDKERLEK